MDLIIAWAVLLGGLCVFGLIMDIVKPEDIGDLKGTPSR